MVCVNYDFYSCTYGGTAIPRQVFDGFAQRAKTLLDSMMRTGTEIEDPEKIKRVLCEICDRLYREDSHLGIARESLDGYEVTYQDDGADSEILRLVRRHLGSSGVLYRGR